MRHTLVARVVPVLLAALLALSGLALPAGAATLECDGKPVTIAGTTGDDDLVGTAGDDVIHARGGNDRVEGRGGDDVLCGGDGVDFLYGDTRHDVDGGNGRDVLVTGAGEYDTVYAGGGADRIDASESSDSRHAGTYTYAGPGDDRFIGGPRPDVVVGGRGADRLDAGGGHDILAFGLYEQDGRVVEPERVVVDLEAGTARTAAGLESAENFEGIAQGTSLGDRFYGTHGADTFSRLGSNAEVYGRGGRDYINGGRLVRAGSGLDIVYANRGTEEMYGGDGDDHLIGFYECTICDNPGKKVFGGAGRDEIQGFAANEGNDHIEGGNGRDLVSFHSYCCDEGGWTIDLGAGTATQSGPMSDDTSDSEQDTLIGIENVVGSWEADVIYGSAVANRLVGDRDVNGQGGDDVLHGRGGDDVLIGSALVDSAHGGEGTDTCDAEVTVSCERQGLT